MNITIKILLYSIFFLSAQNTFACKCKMISVKEDYDNSDVVLSGKILRSRLITYTGDEQSGEKRTVRRYTVQTSKVYKGDKRVKTFYIYTTTSSASCGSNLRVGRKYIVYANRDDNSPVKQQKNSYWTNTCHRTKLFSTTEIAEINGLTP